MRSIRRHSYLLSCFIRNEVPLSASKVHLKDITPTSDMVADWLEMASAVRDVSVDFNYYDDTSYCGTAYDFQKERSGVIATVSTALTTFQYIWNAFELFSKCLEISNLPNGLKDGRPSFVDNVQFFIKERFDSQFINKMIFYSDTVDQLRSETSELSFHDFTDFFEMNAYTNQIGIGIQVVRQIRNLFAHGAIHAPQSENHSWDKYIDGKVIDLSSRIVLLTIQALILSYSFVPYSSEYEFIDLDYPFWDGVDWENLYVLTAETKNEANQAITADAKSRTAE